MPTPRVDDEQILERLAEVFQLHGYEGASLSLLSAATGLQRASLYHRFPGGKAEMAESVLRRTARWLETNVLQPLAGSGPPADRVRHLADRIAEIYHRGHRSCLLNTMSLGGAGGPFHEPIRETVEAWIAAMRDVAIEAGFELDAARRRAEDAFVRIQGSLVLARTTGDTAAFEHALEGLPEHLTDEVAGGSGD